jgi:hypothetical protein
MTVLVTTACLCCFCINCIKKCKICPPLLQFLVLFSSLVHLGPSSHPCLVWPGLGALTTVQQRGQNHQSSARARSRNRISRAMARMEPSACGAKREPVSSGWIVHGLPSQTPPPMADLSPEKSTACQACCPSRWVHAL